MFVWRLIAACADVSFVPDFGSRVYASCSKDRVLLLLLLLLRRRWC